MNATESMIRFCKELGAECPIPAKEIVSIGVNVYWADEKLQKKAARRKETFSIGAPLGEIWKGKFKPSFLLLDEIAKISPNYVILNEKSEWLFICGRDVFKEGTIESHGKEGGFVIVLNTRKEALGYGALNKDAKAYIKNMLDRGDFLRRERLERR